MYYLKLINKKKLKNFWIFLGGDFKGVFKINYGLVSFLYEKYVFTNFKKLIISLKKVVPLILNLNFKKSTIFFVATKLLYSKSIITGDKMSLIKKIVHRKPGIFTNFSICNHENIEDFYLNSNPSLLIFFHSESKNKILIESKEKNIPSLGFINLTTNRNLFDYSVSANTSYFFTTYFFMLLLFKFLKVKN